MNFCCSQPLDVWCMRLQVSQVNRTLPVSNGFLLSKQKQLRKDNLLVQETLNLQGALVTSLRSWSGNFFMSLPCELTLSQSVWTMWQFAQFLDPRSGVDSKPYAGLRREVHAYTLTVQFIEYSSTSDILECTNGKRHIVLQLLCLVIFC